MSEPKSYISFQEVPRNHRTEIPNIVFEMLEKELISPADFTLYCTYRRIAGESGACWYGTRALEKKCRLSHPTIKKSKIKLSSPFAILNGKSLIEITPCDRQKEQADTITIIDVWPENHAYFKNKLRCEKVGHTGVKKEGTQERTIEERTNYYCEPEKSKPPSPPPKPDSMPAGGNNNYFYKCLKKCTDLSDRQKQKLMVYSEPQVERAVRYVYHPTTKIEGGPLGRFKLIQYVLKNPEDFTKTIDNLDKPKTKASKKDTVIGKFKHGEIYNGYEFCHDDIGVGFFKSNMRQPYSVNHKDPNFNNKFLELLNKLEINYE